jgi:DNA repair exonuclease SbcCD ATPase subunit
MRLIKDVFESMVAKVNELVGNPKVFKAKAETGKALGITVSFGGEKSVGIQNMSAGQRRLLDIMIMLAVNSLFEQRYNIENGMLGIAFYDEVIAYLGPEYLDIVFTALSNTRARTRVMITHDADLMSYYNRSIRVSREGGFTQYQLINT